MSERKSLSLHLKRNLIAGVLTLIPILVVWVVLDFVLSFLSSVGSPVGAALIRAIVGEYPDLAPVLTDDAIEWVFAVAVALLLIYVIGAAASRVIGMKLIAAFESLIARIPFVQSIYSASKKLVAAWRQPQGSASRAVLVEYPAPPMKTIALVMRTYRDEATGEEMALVYVPTAFNPTAGFVEMVAVDKLIQTNLTSDQAMAIVISGGAVAPDHIRSGPNANVTVP